MSDPFTAQSVLLEGVDAISFAHAQFSSQVRSLPRGQWQFSTWLSAQGRVRALFHLIRVEENQLLLLLRGGDAGLLAAALQRYVFRAKVSITAIAPRTLGTGPALPLYAVNTADDGLLLGCGDHCLSIGAQGTGDSRWRLPQLRAGWPWLPTTELDVWLAPALSLQRLQATVTDKGCYPGQEIIARLHFRGGHKWHMHYAALSRPMCAGDRLHLGGQDVGCVLDTVVHDGHAEALVILVDTSITDLHDGRLDVHDDNVVILLHADWPA